MALSTWSADTSAWSGNSYIWNNNTYSAIATIAANNTLATTHTLAIPVSATLTQIIFSELNEEDTVFPRSLSMGMNAGMTGVVTVAVPVTATLDTELGDFKTNINFEESATLAATSGISSDNSFLWNDIAEDTGTTWTKISDPDE